MGAHKSLFAHPTASKSKQDQFVEQYTIYWFTISCKGMVQNLEAGSDRKRINTCPSGAFSLSSSSYIRSD